MASKPVSSKVLDKVTPDAKRYFLSRINSIETDHLLKINGRVVTKTEKLSEKRQRELIRYGDVELKKDFKVSDSLADAFDFSEHLPVIETNSKELEKAKTAIKAAAIAIRDKLHAGVGSTDIVKLIREFETASY